MNILIEELSPKQRERLNTFAPYVYPYLGKDVWLAGGSLLDFKRRHEPVDYDLFAQRPAELGAEFGYIIRESALAWTYKNNIQVIKRSYNSIEDLLNSFDFTIRMIGTDGTFLYKVEGWEEAHNNKKIVFNPGEFSNPLTSLVSVVKYGQKGYTLDYEECRNFLSSWGVKNSSIMK